MKTFAARRPLVFSLLVVAVLFGLTYASRAAFPANPVGDVSGLSEEQLAPPSGLDLIASSLATADTLFWALAILLALLLLALLGWWREAGLTSGPRWRNLYLLWFPLLLVALTVSNGVYVPGVATLVSALLAALVAVVGEEILFRGVLWRALLDWGPLWAAISTSLLAGALTFGRYATGGPVPEAIYVSATAACASLTYAALRWRAASLWPVVLAHTALALATATANLSSTMYPILLRLSTFGFLIYGLWLLRNERVRADGG